MIELEDLKELRKPYRKIVGVYFLFDKDQIVYIGQSVDILTRIGYHVKDKIFDSYCWVECKPEELDNLESDYIVKYAPKYNVGVSTCAKWVSLYAIKKLTRADMRTIKKIIKANQMEAINGYYLRDRVLELVKAGIV